MITVTAISSDSMLCVDMAGLLSVEEVQRFHRDKLAMLRQMGLGPGQYVCLVITRGNQIQTQEVTAALDDILHNSPVKPRKIAVVRDGVLTRMQARRVLGANPTAQIFEDMADAREWLMAADEITPLVGIVASWNQSAGHRDRFGGNTWRGADMGSGSPG